MTFRRDDKPDPNEPDVQTTYSCETLRNARNKQILDFERDPNKFCNQPKIRALTGGVVEKREVVKRQFEVDDHGSMKLRVDKTKATVYSGLNFNWFLRN